MVLHFAFKSVIHFQFIFLKSKGLCLDSSFLCMNIQFSSTICWRECFHFIVLTAFAPVPKINWLLMGVYFRAVYSVLLIYWLVFSSIPYYLSFLKKIFKVYLFIYLFIFDCAGSLLLHTGFPWSQCAGFSLLWLLLWQSTASRGMGFGSCGIWAK